MCIRTIFVVIVFFLGAAFNLYSQKNQTDANGLKQGYWEKTYDNGVVKYQGTFKDNKPTGEFKRFFQNGRVSAILNYREGDEAKARIYNEQGHLVAQGLYINNKKDSVWNYYSNDSVLVSRETFTMGVKNGQEIKYYSNGVVYEIINFNNNVKHGEWIQYFDNGSLKLKSYYNEGKLHGRFEVFTPEGKPDVNGFYVNDLMHGIWQFSNEKGETIDVKYVKGVPANADELNREQSKKIEEWEKNKTKYKDPDESEIGMPNTQQEQQNYPQKSGKPLKKR